MRPVIVFLRIPVQPERKKKTIRMPKKNWTITVGAEVAASSRIELGGATAAVCGWRTGVEAICRNILFTDFSSVE